MSDPVLSVNGLTLAFGGVTALDDVTFDAQCRETRKKNLSVNYVRV